MELPNPASLAFFLAVAMVGITGALRLVAGSRLAGLWLMVAATTAGLLVRDFWPTLLEGLRRKSDSLSLVRVGHDEDA